MSDVRHFSTTCSRKPSSPTERCQCSVKRAVVERGRQLRRQLVELDAHRQGDAVAEGERFALTERRQELQQARARVGDRRGDDLLVAVVRHAQREHGVALGQDRRIDLGRTLRDDAQRNAVLAAFLGDLGDGAFARLEAEMVGCRDVAMRFFAHQRQRHLALAPMGEVEGHARQHRDDDVDDLGRQAGQLDDGDRLVVDGHAEDAAEHLRHAVVDGERAEHEGVAAVLRDGIDARAQLPVGREVRLFSSLPMRSSMRPVRSEMR